MIAINLSPDASGADNSAPAAPMLGEQVASKLRDNSYSTLKQVRCEVQDGLVILRGRLPSFFLKQIAQTLSGQVSGVRQVLNQIEVAE